MPLKRELQFVLLLLLSGIALQIFSYDDTRVAHLRWEEQARLDRGLGQFIATHCGQLIAMDDNPHTRFFAERFSFPLGKGNTPNRCILQGEVSQTNRFYLRDHWVFSVKIRAIVSDAAYLAIHQVEFPRPLCLLPLIAFILGVIFQFRVLSAVWILLIHLLLLNELSLIKMMATSVETLKRTALTDQTFWGLGLILAWLAILRARAGNAPLSRFSARHSEGILSRAVSGILGLWNPLLFSLGGRLLSPIRGNLSRLIPFLNAQVLVICASLYALALEFRSLGDILSGNFVLPRYFSFTVILLFLTSSWRRMHLRVPALWHLPRIGLGLLFVLWIELLAHYWSPLSRYSFLVRIGMGLLLSEGVRFEKFPLKAWAKIYFPFAGCLLIGCWLPMVSFESGLTQLGFVLCDPRIHPNNFVLFTFLSGLMVGFVTGSFSLTFFALFDLLSSFGNVPLTKAALLDGLLAGTLLCPYSLYNILMVGPSLKSLHAMMVIRFRQLRVPLAVATIVYMVGVLQTVQILRPLVFLFLVMLIISFQLKKGAWTISKSKFWIDAHSDQH